MKKFFALVLLGLTWSVTLQATILPFKGILDAHEITTGLRYNPDGSWYGPITIKRATDTRGVNVIVDYNICSLDRFCSRGAPITYFGIIKITAESERFLKYSIDIIDAEGKKTADVYTLTVFKNTANAMIQFNEMAYPATSYVWMVKYDGSISCGIEGQSLAEMSKSLSDAGVEIKSMSKATSGAVLPSVCGIPTSSLNGYLIPSDQQSLAQALEFYNLDQFPFGELLEI